MQFLASIFPLGFYIWYAKQYEDGIEISEEKLQKLGLDIFLKWHVHFRAGNL
jgi:hypothetical protein